MLAAGLGDGAGLFERADGGIGSPGGGFEPGGLAALAPLLAELALGLVEHDEGDAVFAAGVAGAGERGHEAEAGDLVEEEDDTAAGQAAVGLIDGVEQGADDDAGERRRRLQHLHGDVDEEIDIAGDEIGGAKPAARDEGGIARIGEPFGLFAHIAVDAGKGLGDEVHELAGHVAGARGMGILVDARELLAHGLLGQSEAGGERDEVAPASGRAGSKTMSERSASTMALPRPSKKALPALGVLLVAGGFSPQIQSTTARMSPSIRGESGFSQSRALKAPSRLIGSMR